MRILEKFTEQNKYSEEEHKQDENVEEEKNADEENAALILSSDVLSEALTVWSEPEFKKYNKDKKWFLTGGSVIFAITLIMLAMKNFIGAFVLVLLGFAVYLYALKEPQVYQFAVHPKGIAVGSKFYNFNDIDSFWIFERGGNDSELVLKGEKFFMPRVYIPISQIESGELREILSEFIAEEEEEESLIDLVSRRMGF